MIQISFRTQDPSIRHAQSGIRVKTLHLIHDPLCFQNPPIRSIYGKNPQSVRLLRPNPSIRKPIHPPPVSYECMNRVEFFSIIFRETSEKNSDQSQQTIFLQPFRSKIETLAYTRFPAPWRQSHAFTAVSYWPTLWSSSGWSNVTRHFYKSYEKPPTDAILFSAV